MDTEYTILSELPGPRAVSAEQDVYREYALVAQKHIKKWVKIPGLTASQRANLQSSIAKGTRSGFKDGCYTARQRNLELYVCYLGSLEER